MSPEDLAGMAQEWVPEGIDLEQLNDPDYIMSTISEFTDFEIPEDMVW